MTVDASTGQISWNPVDFAGADSVTVTLVADNDCPDEADAHFEVTIYPCDPPVIADLGDFVLADGELLDVTPWMANPAQLDADRNSLWLAHCTVPRTLVESYRLRSHFESGLGVGIQGSLATGPVTLLRTGGKQLKETRVINTMIVIVSGMDVERRLGHGARPNIQHIGQALADCGIEGLVHVSDALTRREISSTEPGHGQTRGHRGGGMFPLRFDKDQRTAGDVDVARGRSLGPELAHLR